MLASSDSKEQQSGIMTRWSWRKQIRCKVSCSLAGMSSSVSRVVEAGMTGVAGLELDRWKGAGFELWPGRPPD